ncbi:protein BIC1 [Vigna radiata var. radiata]|uniref:Protein BIC1 n=1 Tax=Vigna radiata var. radiata TaxID=3916 RepID=A0A1S3TUT7_VIGRR|nr:protein BIC1 [Vigna radiata var. radiata]
MEGKPNEIIKNSTQDDKLKEVRVEETGREKLKRLREEVMMMEKVNIPEDWGQEQKLNDWVDYTMFNAFLAPHSLIVSARDALIANACKPKSPRLRTSTSF